MQGPDVAGLNVNNRVGNLDLKASTIGKYGPAHVIST